MKALNNRRKRITLLLPALILILLGTSGRGAPPESAQGSGRRQAGSSSPTFYRDVLPILQERCQICHRASGIAPMRFETYGETRPYAGAIGAAAQNKSMPPWFADPHIGRFSNDPSLSSEQIAELVAWASAGA